ncbi:MAG: DUF3077 domain-containing protein [Burkholderiaceae bacterium]|jgi:hypothetical protein|nr:DUF3077 domain-containing protein [Burkholderiaceae bacterium]
MQTITLNFSKCSPTETILAVREGVPVGDAIEHASLMLCAALGALREREADDFLCGVEHLIETAKALIDAVPTGRMMQEAEA